MKARRTRTVVYQAWEPREHLDCTIRWGWAGFTETPTETIHAGWHRTKDEVERRLDFLEIRRNR